MKENVDKAWKRALEIVGTADSLQSQLWRGYQSMDVVDFRDGLDWKLGDTERIHLSSSAEYAEFVAKPQELLVGILAGVADLQGGMVRAYYPFLENGTLVRQSSLMFLPEDIPDIMDVCAYSEQMSPYVLHSALRSYRRSREDAFVIQDHQRRLSTTELLV